MCVIKLLSRTIKLSSQYLKAVSLWPQCLLAWVFTAWSGTNETVVM